MKPNEYSNENIESSTATKIPINSDGTCPNNLSGSLDTYCCETNTEHDKKRIADTPRARARGRAALRAPNALETSSGLAVLRALARRVASFPKTKNYKQQKMALLYARMTPSGQRKHQNKDRPQEFRW